MTMAIRCKRHDSARQHTYVYCTQAERRSLNQRQLKKCVKELRTAVAPGTIKTHGETRQLETTRGQDASQ